MRFLGIRMCVRRMYTVHPKNDECFYLRLLLVNVRGPTSFETLRTVNGVIFPTYRAACEELNLLENDTHWDTTIAEAIISLLLIEDMCYLMCGSLLIRLRMPSPNREMNDAFNRELEREREYDQQELDLVPSSNECTPVEFPTKGSL
ncbi:unnamed protein product [Arctia plantaginis]|uniref:Uncharacterized protein n=1 Tax=Arctia plantaginis TaxID=874455 RepID=A0A8S1AX50_ARCPL|nr:unnamed protein product [Arctia plantaginis]